MVVQGAGRGWARYDTTYISISICLFPVLLAQKFSRILVRNIYANIT